MICFAVHFCLIFSHIEFDCDLDELFGFGISFFFYFLIFMSFMDSAAHTFRLSFIHSRPSHSDDARSNARFRLYT